MKSSLDSWSIPTKKIYGLQEIVNPKKKELTQSLYAYRLDLKKGMKQEMLNKDLELSFILVAGSALLKCAKGEFKLKKFDSFYIPSNEKVILSTDSDCTFYIGGALDEGYGKFYLNTFNSELPLGDVRQIHGQEPYQRDVYMTLGANVPASRLITGLTWSEPGKWASWPPHQHECDLEEAYWYFDMPAPKFGLHLSFEKSGEPTNVTIVRSGDMVLAPYGYHPTVAAPSNKNAYVWILASHNHLSRRYDLAINDSAYTK